MEKSRLKSGLIFVLVLVLGIVLALILFYYQTFYKMEGFWPGVEIGGLPVQGYTVEGASSLLDQRIAEFSASPVVFSRDEYSEQISLGELCYPLDVGQIVEKAWEEERNRSWKDNIARLFNRNKTTKYPVAITYDPTKLNKLVEGWDDKWGVPFKNPRLVVDARKGLIIEPGQAGQQIDFESTFKGLPKQLGNAASLELAVVTKPVSPEVTDKDLANMGELASYSTRFNPGEINRTHNLNMAASMINNTIILPNKIFSFNHQVGKRSAEKGYRDAMVIVDGKFEPGLGGGICQVSSTLYNTVLLAGLPIVERHNHALAVAYVPVGRDATVNYGVQDLKFKNNTDSPLYLRALVWQGQLVVTVYGNLSYKQKVEVYQVVDQVIDYRTIQETDPQLKPGEQKLDHNGIPGYRVRTFRKIFDQQAQVKITEKLSTDSYMPLNKVILMGPEPGSTPDLDPNNPDSKGEQLPNDGQPSGSDPADVPLVPLEEENGKPILEPVRP